MVVWADGLRVELRRLNDEIIQAANKGECRVIDLKGPLGSLIYQDEGLDTIGLT